MMTNWFDRVILGRKEGQKRPRLKLDKWFLVFMALLLWSLGTILYQYAWALPYNLTNYAYWLRMLAVVVAIFGWAWLFKIYASSVRETQKTFKEIGEKLADVAENSQPGQRLINLEQAIESLKQGELPKAKGGKK